MWSFEEELAFGIVESVRCGIHSGVPFSCSEYSVDYGRSVVDSKKFANFIEHVTIESATSFELESMDHHQNP
jgi:hypothetical protein